MIKGYFKKLCPIKMSKKNLKHRKNDFLFLHFCLNISISLHHSAIINRESFRSSGYRNDSVTVQHHHKKLIQIDAFLFCFELIQTDWIASKQIKTPSILIKIGTMQSISVWINWISSILIFVEGKYSDPNLNSPLSITKLFID